MDRASGKQAIRTTETKWMEGLTKMENSKIQNAKSGSTVYAESGSTVIAESESTVYAESGSTVIAESGSTVYAESGRINKNGK